MDTKTRKELLALCKETGLKGYSTKTKAELIQLLSPPVPQVPPPSFPPVHTLSSPDYTLRQLCCMEGMELLKQQGQRVHFTVTSPPYFNVKDYVNYTDYKEYLSTLTKVFTLVYELTHEGRMCAVNLSNILVQRPSRNGESRRIPLAFHFVPLMEEIGWKFIEDIVWTKPEGAAKNRNGGFFQHRQPVAYKPNVINEYIFIFQKPSAHLIDKIVRSYDATISEQSRVSNEYERTNVWKINPETKVNHPAPYPEQLAEQLIKYYSFVGDTVLDPFMGSGTSAVASVRWNRKVIGFELHKEYMDIAEERLKTTTKQPLHAVTLQIDEYLPLTEEQRKAKLSKLPKKVLFQLASNSTFKTYSKEKLVDEVYALRFVNTT